MKTLNDIFAHGTADELNKAELLQEIEGDIRIARYLGSLPEQSLEALQDTARDLRAELGLR